MHDTEEQVTGGSLAKGIFAGMVGGLAGTVARTFVERIYPSEDVGQVSVAASDVRSGTATRESLRAEGIEWALGAITGAAYGAIVEFYPAATSKNGASFGLAIGSLMHEGALLSNGDGLSHEPDGLRERTTEFTAHIAYGVVTESVRKVIRRFL